MLKYALVEVFGEKEKKTTVILGMLDNCGECYIISVAWNSFLRKNKLQDKLKYLHYIQF